MVLPDHMHCLWTLPEGDTDFPGRWRAIKTAFSKALPGAGVPSDFMVRRGERGIWQRRLWEHVIRDAGDHAVHMDYTHFNPASMGMFLRRWSGRIRRFGVAWRRDDIRRGGVVARMSWRRRASGGERKVAECAALFRPTLAVLRSDGQSSCRGRHRRDRRR